MPEKMEYAHTDSCIVDFNFDLLIHCRYDYSTYSQIMRISLPSNFNVLRLPRLFFLGSGPRGV
jgi:hypothetical protein